LHCLLCRFVGWAEAISARGNNPEARRLLARALEIDPHFVDAHTSLARLLQAHTHLFVFYRFFESLTVSFGWYAQREGDVEAAAEHFDRAHALEPRNPTHIFNLAQAREYSADAIGARAFLRRCITHTHA
jgi:Tfp pilus assembly protein PilF